jgi:transposase InsO family protein
VHHSDRGSQYASEQFQRLLADHDVTYSMSRSGNVWDKAAMESFFSSTKTERTTRKTYRTREEGATARSAITVIARIRKHSIFFMKAPKGRNSLPRAAGNGGICSVKGSAHSINTYCLPSRRGLRCF